MIEVQLGANRYVAKVESDKLGDFLLEQLAARLANSELTGETEDKTRENIRNAVITLPITTEHSNSFLFNLDGANVNGECDRTNLGKQLLANETLRGILETRILQSIAAQRPAASEGRSTELPAVRSFEEIQSLVSGRDEFNALVADEVNRIGRHHVDFSGQGGTASLGWAILRDAREGSPASQITKILGIGKDRTDLPDSLTTMRDVEPYTKESEHFAQILGTAVYEAAKAKYPVPVKETPAATPFSIDGNAKFDAYVEKLAKAYANSPFTLIESVQSKGVAEIAKFLTSADDRTNGFLASLDALYREEKVSDAQKTDVANQVAKKVFAKFNEIRSVITPEQDFGVLKNQIVAVALEDSGTIQDKIDHPEELKKTLLEDNKTASGQEFKALCRMHKIAEADIPQQAERLTSDVIAELKANTPQADAPKKLSPAEAIKKAEFVAVIEAAVKLIKPGDEIGRISALVKDFIRPLEHQAISFNQDLREAFDTACSVHGIEEKDIAPYLDEVGKAVQAKVSTARVERKEDEGRDKLLDEAPPITQQPPIQEHPPEDEPKSTLGTILDYAKEYWKVGSGALAVLVGLITRGPVGILIGIAGAVLAVTQWFNPLSLFGNGGEEVPTDVAPVQ